MEKLDRISLEFDYSKKVSKNWGKFWFEQYSDHEILYKKMLLARNDAVLKAISPGECMLDIGCGFGDMIFLLRERFDKLYGIDPSESMVSASKNNLFAHGVMNCSIEKAIIQKLPYEDDLFDCILLLDVFEHIWPQDVTASLNEIRRVLKPDGRFILVTPNKVMINFWTSFDNLLTRLLRGKSYVQIAKTDGSFTEVFYGRHQLKSILKDAKFEIVNDKRISFYPAPERPGFLGVYMRKILRRRCLFRLLSFSFDVIRSLKFLNQKMLFVLKKSESNY